MRLAAALLLIVLPVLAVAQAPPGAPLMRTTLDPADGIVIGQPVRLRVEVMFPGEMPHPPLVKLADAPGAQILRFETQATTIRDRIAGQDYVGQSFEFLVFPRRGGEIAIPAPDVTLLDRGGDTVGQAKGDAGRISVTVPPGLDASAPVLVADRVTARESWSPDPGSTRFKAGGAITRTIRRQASGVPALGMAELRFTAPEGVRVYVDPPVVDDRANRGTVEGERTDKATYVFEKTGTYTLPALSQPWWDMTNRQVRNADLPGLTVTAEAGASAARPERLQRLSPFVIAAGVGLVVLFGFTAFLWRRFKSGWASLRQWRRSPEHAARRDFQRAAASGDPAATYRALSAWLARLPPAEAANLSADQRARPVLETLERALFGAGASWNAASAAELADIVASVRRTRWDKRTPPDPLPPLNPAYPA